MNLIIYIHHQMLLELLNKDDFGGQVIKHEWEKKENLQNPGWET